GSLAQNPSHPLIALHAYQRIELVLAQVIATAPAVNQAPTLQLFEPAYDRSTGHVHIGSNLGDRKRLAVHVTNRHACSNEESFYARAEGLADRRVSAMHSSHDIDH